MKESEKTVLPLIEAVSAPETEHKVSSEDLDFVSGGVRSMLEPLGPAD